MQVLIYVGGIMILMLFGIMLTGRIMVAKVVHESWQRVSGGLVALGFGSLLVYGILSHAWPDIGLREATPTVEGIGILLFSDYLLLFEVVSILLLGVLIGAATLARRER
jgi:NADH:ubiquinone oxidoreductase subunit 6 (subunit J)